MNTNTDPKTQENSPYSSDDEKFPNKIMYAIDPAKLIPEHLIQQATVCCQKCRLHQNLSQEMADSDNLTIKYSPDNTFGKYIAKSCFSEKCRKLQREELEIEMEWARLKRIDRQVMTVLDMPDPFSKEEREREREREKVLNK
jgi:hypothetical protein